MRVQGSSMNPTLKYGDIIVVLRDNLKNYHINDIVIFFLHDMLFVHRIAIISGDYCITKGDSLYCLDEPIDISSILGKVIEIRRLKND